MLIAAGFGALIHLLHTFATDAGTIIAWSWTGWPINGPTLHPYGGLVVAVIALAAGVQLDLRLATALIIFGLTGLYGMSDWPGFAAGLAAIFGIASALPTYLQNISALPPAYSFGWAMGVYGVLDVLSVITAAYAFVPLGYLLRERTDLILIISCVLIVAGARRPRSLIPSTRSFSRIQSTQRYSIVTIAVIAMTSLAYGYSKVPPTPVPYSPLRMFSAGIWTVHFGVDVNGRDSQQRMKDLLRDMQVDVIGLLESDCEL